MLQTWAGVRRSLHAEALQGTKCSNRMDSLCCQSEGIAGEKKANSTEISLLEVGFDDLFFPALAVVVAV